MIKIHERWEINELQFYWDGHCTLPVLGVSKQQSYSDETFGGVDTSNLAFDNNELTMWKSNCRYELGGCPVFDPTVEG